MSARGLWQRYIIILLKLSRHRLWLQKKTKKLKLPSTCQSSDPAMLIQILRSTPSYRPASGTTCSLLPLIPPQPLHSLWILKCPSKLLHITLPRPLATTWIEAFWWCTPFISPEHGDSEPSPWARVTVTAAAAAAASIILHRCSRCGYDVPVIDAFPCVARRVDNSHDVVAAVTLPTP